MPLCHGKAGRAWQDHLHSLLTILCDTHSQSPKRSRYPNLMIVQVLFLPIRYLMIRGISLGLNHLRKNQPKIPNWYTAYFFYLQRKIFKLFICEYNIETQLSPKNLKERIFLRYHMSKKFWPILYSKLLFEMDQDFLNIQYIILWHQSFPLKIEIEISSSK